MSRIRPVRLLLIIVAALAIVGVPAGLYVFNSFRSHGIATYMASRKPPVLPVTVATAVAGPMARDLSAIGTLQAVHQVTIVPEAGGRVVQILFQPGARVKAGEPLVQLNDAPLRGDLANYEAQARIAALTLHRAQTLVGKHFETQANVDQAQAVLDQQNALIAKTQAQIAQLLVRAPFAGVLGVRQIDLGQYLSAGTPIVTLTDPSELYVNFSLPEQNRAQLGLGQPVSVESDAFTGTAFQARLTTIEPQISTDTRMISLQATLPNPSGRLASGMYVNAAVILPAADATVTIPETAVDYNLYGDTVYRVVPAEGGGMKAVQTVVHAGRRLGAMVAIVDGVAAGDRVVTSGQVRLSNGAAVAVSETGALTVPAAVPTE